MVAANTWDDVPRILDERSVYEGGWGHDYDEDNTYYSRTGKRNCRACGRENARKYRAALAR